VPPPARPALDRVPAAAPGNARGSGQFGILFVCTGNICRSVMAERLARRGLRARLGADACRFRVLSAGTAGLTGCGVHPYAAEALNCLGADADGFTSRALTAADVAAADLILAAGQEHRNEVIAMRPDASRRVYLLREFARLAPFAAGHAMGTAAGRPARRPAGFGPGAAWPGAAWPGAAWPGAAWPGAGLTEAGLTEAGLTEAGLAEAGLAEAGLAEAGLAGTARADSALSAAAGAGANRSGPCLSAVEHARHLVASVAQLRGRVPYVEPAEDEIADPFTSSAFHDCARSIDAAVSQALDALCRGLPRAQYRGRHAR
jgi:protein-tyrosine-phosphatase